MGFHDLILLFFSAFCVFCIVSCSAQLQSSQTEVLLQLKKHLEYPKPLDIWKDRWTDLCSVSSSSQVNVSCKDNFVTELIIFGDNDKPTKIRDFDGFSIPNHLTLSQSFSMDSLVATLARLTSLRILRLVSLGIWGPLPDRIHRLYALEHLDLSSNYLYGSIPPKISTMVNLQIIDLGDNFFNGTIPSFFNSSSNLTVVSFRNNELKGPFPNSILGITTLTEIDMSSNQISGNLHDLTGLSSLEKLDLSGNKLESELPEIPKGLMRLFLSRNSFSGEIPKHYGQLIRIQQIDVSFNALTGTVPSELFSLPNISYLSLASNMLSGTLQNQLKCSNQLRFVDISNNRFLGGMPFCLRNTKSEHRVVKSDGNCLSGEFQHQHAVSYCTEAEMKKKPHRVEIVVGSIVGILVIILLLALCIFIACRRYYPKGVSEQHLLHKSVQDSYSAGLSSDIVTNARYVSESAKLGKEDLPMCRSYSMEELKEATNNFDNSTSMGENLYGKLYRGILESGIQVVIRCLPLSKKYTIRNFKLRLDLLAKLRHPNLVSLLGHCIDVVGDQSDTNVYLVYEYVSNGSFQPYLTGNSAAKVFNWSERLSVLVSIAKAIHFLHTGMIPGFFKNRLKTNNILINEQFIAKLSDYGLSIISEETDAVEVNGESTNSWPMKKLEDDVYSFGFIILEALVGPSVSAKREATVLNAMASFNGQDEWKQVVDTVVQATCSKESLLTVISITNKCISPESWSRPSIEDVLWNLQYASQLQATADGDQKN